MNLIAIKVKDGYYVSDNVKDESYFYTKIFSNKYDVEILKTFHKDWGLCKDLPKLVFNKKPDQNLNPRWELKQGFPESELTPKILSSEPDHDIRGLYTYCVDKIEGEEYSEEIVVEVIAEQDDFEIKQLSYNVSHNLIDRITTPSILLVNKATKIGCDESYKIIREFVKANINPLCAKITSDYDFHFAVSKIISHKPEEYLANISHTKKTKYETRYRRERTVKILDLQTKGNSFSGSSFAPEFQGKNYDDCMSKLNEYLDNLKVDITTPTKECEHCNGTGIEIPS